LERSKAGYVTAARTWRRKYEEAVAELREREERLERTYRTVEHVRSEQPAAGPSHSPPAATSSASHSPPQPHSPRGLSVYEEWAIAEMARREARREEDRRRDRYHDTSRYTFNP
jgi:hypothetical protein